MSPAGQPGRVHLSIRGEATCQTGHRAQQHYTNEPLHTFTPALMLLIIQLHTHIYYCPHNTDPTVIHTHQLLPSQYCSYHYTHTASTIQILMFRDLSHIMSRTIKKKKDVRFLVSLYNSGNAMQSVLGNACNGILISLCSN